MRNDTRPKRTLFSFTRKRIYDSLLMRFLQFDVQQSQPKGNSIEFCYGNKVIHISSLTNHDKVLIRSYRKTKGSEPLGDFVHAEYTDRSEVNKRIVQIFEQIDKMQSGGAN